MTVNNEFERMQKVRVVRLTWNLSRRNKKRHEGPPDHGPHIEKETLHIFLHLPRMLKFVSGLQVRSLS
jgi:hypothetical protein